MGWQSYHLYEFEIELEKNPDRLMERMLFCGHEETFEGQVYEQVEAFKKHIDDLDLEKVDHYERMLMTTQVERAWTRKLPRYVEDHPVFMYRYDFGDYWEHEVRLEKMIEDYAYVHPTLLEGDGICPPEDVGGPWGYGDFLQVMNNPADPEHEETRHWALFQGYRPLDVEKTNWKMSELLKLKRKPKE